MRLVICSLLFLFSSLQANDVKYDTAPREERVAIPKDETVSGNYYYLGDAIIEGKVEGSLYLMGGQVIILGDVGGDLNVLGGSVFISGTVAGQVRVIAGQAIIEGDMLKDVTFVGANLLLPEGSKIEGNLFAVSGNIDLSDVVGGHVHAAASSLSVSGTIKKNLKTFVDRLQINKGGEILGDLTYRSFNKASIDSQASVKGTIHYKPTLLKEIEDMWFVKGVTFGSSLLPIFVKLFYTFIIGCLLIALFPRRLKTTLNALQKWPGRSFLYGLLVLSGLPILVALLLITVIGAPFALTLLALNIISFYTVTIFFILWVSNFIFRNLGWKENTVWSLIAGLIIYHFLTAIPILGIIVACSATVFGFGAAIVSQTKKA